MVREALYHREVGSNSIKRLDPGGIGPLVKSSINGIRGTTRTCHYDSGDLQLCVLVLVSVRTIGKMADGHAATPILFGPSVSGSGFYTPPLHGKSLSRP